MINEFTRINEDSENCIYKYLSELERKVDHKIRNRK